MSTSLSLIFPLLPPSPSLPASCPQLPSRSPVASILAGPAFAFPCSSRWICQQLLFYSSLHVLSAFSRALWSVSRFGPEIFPLLTLWTLPRDQPLPRAWGEDDSRPRLPAHISVLLPDLPQHPGPQLHPVVFSPSCVLLSLHFSWYVHVLLNC